MPKILLVDDAQTMRESLRNFFVANGLEVVEAADGEQGLEMLRLHSVDMVISDLNMPTMDGVTMCKHMKEQGYNIPVFMLTAQSNPELKAKAKEFGVVAWIIKPPKEEVLLPAIRKILKL